MFRYIEQIPAWGLQISALKHAYADKNITVHVTREFGNTDALYKDNTGQTSPLYYVLQNGKVAKLEAYLHSRYPDATAYTNQLMQNIAQTINKQVAQPVAEEPELPAAEVQHDAKSMVQQDPVQHTGNASIDIRADIKNILTEEMAALKKELLPPPANDAPLLSKEMARMVQEYNPNKTFAQEYQWVPALFNWLYFMVSPFVAIFGALFFYTQVGNTWLLVGLIAMFLVLELVFRRTIVRKCVAAFMRNRHKFGIITLILGAAISAWSVVAIWQGTAQMQSMADGSISVFNSSPAKTQISALNDSIAVWRTTQKTLEGKWGVSLHISKDLTKRIAAGEAELELLEQQLQMQNNTGIATWRYLFLLLEGVVLLALVLPVWYEVRCVLETLEKQP